ncbi:50S ribosomal protein L23 [Patescibacteria group bacterium]|nr:50S ribosomal protein L23 [Patescibacteria group bacterium]
MNIKDTIIEPVLTEKATNLVKNKVYMFVVNIKANKRQVKETIEKIYKVKVSGVRVMVRKGKEKRVGRKMMTKKMPNIKVAYVKLKEGKIDIFPQT